MNRVEVIPGLVVDSEMHDAVRVALATHAPDYDIGWHEFATPTRRWILLPDKRCVGFRAEYVLREDQAATVKVNLWLAPDLRGGDRPIPHSHPCPFVSYIVMGGYVEQRYQLIGGDVHTQEASHRQGGQNTMPRHVYHEVVDVDQPGRTLTLMVGGPGTRGGWGYLNPETGEHAPAQPDPQFTAQLRHLNPHRR